MVPLNRPGPGIDVIHVMLIFGPCMVGMKGNLLVDIGIDMVDPYADDILIFDRSFFTGR